jgi:V/A-type H+-transporting ATPase subunit C
MVARKRFRPFKIVPYIFPSSYVRGLEAKLLKAGQIQEFVGSESFKDFVEILSRTGYGEYLRGAKSYSDVERAVNQKFVETCQSVSETFLRGKREPLDAYLRKQDIKNLKTVVRGVYNHLTPSETLQMIVPVGKLDVALLRKAAEVEDPKLLPSTFRGTEFEPLLEKLDLEHSEKGFLAFDSALDGLLFATLETGFKGIPALERYLAAWKDLTNIQTTIRAKTEGLTAEELVGLFLSGGSFTSGTRIKRMIEAEGVDEVLNAIALTPYSEAIREAVKECAESKSLTPLDVAINKLLLEKAKEMGVEPVGMGVVLSYIIALEYEITAIKSIAKGKEEGLGAEQLAARIVAW